MGQFFLPTSRRTVLVTVALSLAATWPVSAQSTPTTSAPIDCSKPLPYPDMAGNKDWKSAQTIYEFVAKDLDENDVSLEKYRGHPLIVVNVATYCGLTKNNYKQLNELYSKYKDQGLRILAFPCNQFNNQEPGCSVDIKEFIRKNNVEFDVFSKIDVNGDSAHPLYKWLKSKQGGFMGIDSIKWNFSKFLVNKEGIPVNRYSPTTEPKDIEKDVQPLL